MTIRTSKKDVTFINPFVLGYEKKIFPAGTYCVETYEELLEGISFLAYRRILTLLHLQPKPGQSGIGQVIEIDPGELDAAICQDLKTEAGKNVAE